MSNIEYRPASERDIDQLVRLRVAMQSEVNQRDEQHWKKLGDALREYFASAIPSGEFIAWIAESDGKIVATSGMIFHQHPPNGGNLSGREAYTMNMYTVPEFRGRGIASVLLEKLLEIARAREFPRVVLHAQSRAKPLYARAGFVENDSEMRLAL